MNDNTQAPVAPFQALRDALADLKCGPLRAHMGHVTSEENEDWRALDINCNSGGNKLIGRPLARAIAQSVNAAPALLAEVDRLNADNEGLRSTMTAAAEEIHAHWPAHCDAEGYGPANLMHRLEQGVPALYAYKAGDFERMASEIKRLTAALKKANDQTEHFEREWYLRGDEIERLTAALEVAQVDADKRSRAAVMFGDCLHHNILAMRAAVVAGHLEGPEVGMQWIENSLEGPGNLPDIDAAKAEGGAQALFDREMAEHEAFRAAHPGPAAARSTK